MTVHCIRLGSAWQLIVPALVATKASAFPANISLPVRREALENIPADRPFELRRCFNRPSNLAKAQIVKLAFTGLANGARIRLNGLVLSPDSSTDVRDGAVRFAIQDKLLLRNELAVEFLTCASIPSDRMILDAVSLEIESAARDGR